MDLLELALRSVAAEHSDNPMYFVLPAFRISSRAGMDSSKGVSGTISKCKGVDRSRIRTRIDTMQVVEVRGKAKSFDCAFNVGFDVGG